MREGIYVCIYIYKTYDIYKIMIDSHCFTTETNTIWQSNFPPIKKKLHVASGYHNGQQAQI